MNFLLNLSSRTDMSPKGFVAMLTFVHDMIALEQKSFMQKIFKVKSIKVTCKELPKAFVLTNA
jgi:fused-like protein